MRSQQVTQTLPESQIMMARVECLKISNWMIKLNAHWLSRETEQKKQPGRSCKNYLFTWYYIKHVKFGVCWSLSLITSLTVK